MKALSILSKPCFYKTSRLAILMAVAIACSALAFAVGKAPDTASITTHPLKLHALKLCRLVIRSPLKSDNRVEHPRCAVDSRYSESTAGR